MLSLTDRVKACKQSFLPVMLQNLTILSLTDRVNVRKRPFLPISHIILYTSLSGKRGRGTKIYPAGKGVYFFFFSEHYVISEKFV